MAKRILLFVTDLEIGGTPTVVRELAIRLGAGIEVACLGRWGPVADQIGDAGIEVTALGAAGIHDVQVIAKLARLIHEKHFDTVFSFLIHANFAAAIASRFCHNVRWIQAIQTTQPNPRWHWLMQGIVQNSAEVIVVPSPSVASVAQERARVPAEKILVIPNAVDLSERVSHFTTNKIIRIGFVGRLDPIKRVSDLVHAMNLLDQEFKLDIHGDGEERPRIESEIAASNLGERVRLCGFTAKPRAAMENIDILVLPSEAEGFPLVLIEAMTLGVPVVATNAPGIHDVIEDDVNGLLVPLNNPAALALAINRIWRDKSLRMRLIENGLRAVREKYSWDKVIPQYRRLLKMEA